MRRRHPDFCCRGGVVAHYVRNARPNPPTPARQSVEGACGKCPFHLHLRVMQDDKNRWSGTRAGAIGGFVEGSEPWALTRVGLWRRR